MAGHAELKVEGGVHLVTPTDLEEDVRRARVPLDALVHFPPWTGETWRRVGEIDALADAIDAPEARFAAHLQSPPRGGLTLLLVLTLVVAAAAQFAARDALAANHGALLHRLSLGWEPTLLDGAWWSPFTAALLHESFFHLLGNLVILTYCSWRCERALGAVGLLGVVAGALLGGTVGVTLFSPLPCIGSSVLAFGVWGGQFAIGWRHGPSIPPAQRPYYGAGTFLVAVPLLAWTLANPQVSSAGHLGGFFGGMAGVWLLPRVTHASRQARKRVGRQAVLTAIGLAILPVVGSTSARFVPRALAFPGEDVLDPESGLEVTLPWRYAEALPASDTPIDVLLPSPTPDLALHIARVEEGVDPHGSFVVHGAAEHHGAMIEVGWTTAASFAPARLALYAEIAASARWTPPPALDETRARHEHNPDDPAAAFAYARSLELSGDVVAAIAGYAALDARDDEWSTRSARALTRLCAITPDSPGCAAP